MEAYSKIKEAIDTLPYGDCELVALIMSRFLPGSQIIHGRLKESIHGQEFFHCWVEKDGQIFDPSLHDFWSMTGIERIKDAIIDPEQIEASFMLFADFATNNPDLRKTSPFPLRWEIWAAGGINAFVESIKELTNEKETT